MNDDNNTQLVEASREAAESTAVVLASSDELPGQATAAPIEEIRTDEPAPPAASQKQKEAPSPLLADPYEFSQCTITVLYTLLADRKNVCVSVHSHKDAPIVKTFPEAEVPLPERVSHVMNTLREIWPGSEVSATLVLLPKGAAEQRTLAISIRANRDTPLVQICQETEVPFPAPIITMLDELKALLPGRAMESIQKAAKTAKNTKRRSTCRNPTRKTGRRRTPSLLRNPPPHPHK